MEKQCTACIVFFNFIYEYFHSDVIVWAVLRPQWFCVRMSVFVVFVCVWGSLFVRGCRPGRDGFSCSGWLVEVPGRDSGCSCGVPHLSPSG